MVIMKLSSEEAYTIPAWEPWEAWDPKKLRWLGDIFGPAADVALVDFWSCTAWLAAGSTNDCTVHGRCGQAGILPYSISRVRIGGVRTTLRLLKFNRCNQLRVCWLVLLQPTVYHKILRFFWHQVWATCPLANGQWFPVLALILSEDMHPSEWRRARYALACEAWMSICFNIEPAIRSLRCRKKMEKGETPLANFWMVLEVTVCIISQAYHSIPTFASYFLLFSLLRVEYTAKLDLQVCSSAVQSISVQIQAASNIL